MTFHHQDGIYGLVGPRSLCLSPDKQDLYVSTQYNIVHFSYDSLTGSTEFIGAYINKNNGIEGLETNATIKVSPDGKHVYTTSYHLHCVSLFNRSEESGELEYVTSFYDEQNGNEGLRGVEGMTFGKDGLRIYFAAWNDKEISVYQRDPISGSIAHLQSIGGLTWPDALAISHDGRSLFVVDDMGDRMGVYQIHETSGLLSFHQMIDTIYRLYSPEAVEVSRDDAFVYLLCRNSLIVLARDPVNETLSHHTTFHADDLNIEGLHGSYSIAVSEDDSYIYTISADDTSFVSFKRDISSNTFQFVQALGFEHPYDIGGTYSSSALLSTKNYLYGTAYWPCMIHIAEQEQAGGPLNYRENISAGQGASIDGLYNPVHSCLNHAEDLLFVTCHTNGISVFERNDTNGWLKQSDAIVPVPFSKFLRYSRKSIISPDDQFLYTLSGFGNEIAIYFFGIDNQLNTINFIDSVPGGVNGVQALNMAWDIAMSPDSRFVYVITSMGEVLKFSRDMQTGYLQLLSTTEIQDYCYSANQICLSKDGKYLFAASELDSDLAMFLRDEDSGDISILAHFSRDLPNGIRVYGLENMDVSSDGKNLYVVYKDSDLLVNFRINSESNTINISQFIDLAHYPFNGLKEIDRVHVKYDGTFVFTSSRADHSYGFYYRSQDNGKLTYIHDFREQQWDFDGLDGITWLTTSYNDRNLYICSDVEESISTFKIDLYLGPDREICEGDTITLDAGQAYVIYKWSTNETSRQIKVSEEGWYVVETIDYFGFEDIDSLYLTVHPLPYVELGDDRYICKGDSILLTISNYSNILWSTGSVSNSIWVKNEGSYTVTVTNNNNCSYTDEVYVYVIDQPIVNLGNDTILEYGQPITLLANDNDNYSYLWFDGSTNKTIQIEYSMAHLNQLNAWLIVNNEYSCVSKDSILITWDENFTPPEPYIFISPVPTRDDICIESNYPITRIDCYSMNGKYVFSEDCYGNELHYSLENLLRGMYFFKIRLSNGYSQISKVIRW